MDAQTQTQLKQHLEGIAKILHAEADPADLKTLEGIETTLRSKAQEYVRPELGFFLSKQRQEQQQGKNELSAAQSEKSLSPQDKPNG
jgi:hypothetical protein